jgi:hypothetical protein
MQNSQNCEWQLKAEAETFQLWLSGANEKFLNLTSTNGENRYAVPIGSHKVEISLQELKPLENLLESVKEKKDKFLP